MFGHGQSGLLLGGEPARHEPAGTADPPPFFQKRPKMYREMQEAGTLNQHAQDASKRAAAQVAELMLAGAQKHEAEEIVLPELILLPPEKDEDEEED